MQDGSIYFFTLKQLERSCF